MEEEDLRLKYEDEACLVEEARLKYEKEEKAHLKAEVEARLTKYVGQEANENEHAQLKVE